VNHASLFSGIGGFDLAAEWMGWTNVLHVERDPTRQRDTLAHAMHDPTHGKTSQLNPRFVAEMMGFPVNWTELPFQSGELKASKPTETL
jgi:site-specific DNA-cytosine methylase